MRIANVAKQIGIFNIGFKSIKKKKKRGGGKRKTHYTYKL